MTLHYQDDWLTVHLGDCREVMASMEPESVHCVVTSPPYWGLRDYGTATWEGGAPDCDHLAGPLTSDKSGLAGYTSENIKLRTNGVPFKGACRKCGAIRQDSQLGLEATPEQYVENMVAVFREVRRVLRSDGTVWLNLGDSYAQHAGRKDAPEGRAAEFERRGKDRGYAPGSNFANYGERMGEARSTVVSGLKPKDLVGIPWRVAFALQADGWYLRSDIIWSKPNPMPESVTDRPTKSHEYIFLLAKSARYYFDSDAVREANTVPDRSGTNPRHPDLRAVNARDRGRQDDRPIESNPAGRNIRSVWTIATQPYPGAHFATFPRKLVEPCIKAGCPEGGVVLDPFAGSGTTAMVAQSLSRRAVLIDLSADYLEQVMERNRAIPLGLGESA